MSTGQTTTRTPRRRLNRLHAGLGPTLLIGGGIILSVLQRCPMQPVAVSGAEG